MMRRIMGIRRDEMTEELQVQHPAFYIWNDLE
jgi:hypothetical protein